VFSHHFFTLSNFYDTISLYWSHIKNGQEIQKAIFRIIQELVTNTLKYASATEIDVELIDIENNINLVYTDNGIGFDKNNYKKGIGIENIFKRLDAIGGQCEINSKPGEGVTFVILIPTEKIT